jgi:hypothetical protein
MRIRPVTVILTLLCCASLSAVTPLFWENFTQDDLLRGTLTRVSLSADGRLSLAPSYEMLYDTGQPFIFSMVRDKAGNLYVGTGHEGKVFKIDPQGKGSLYFQSKELDIFALALDAADTLYVGTSPDGKVYKVTGASQSTEYCNPEEKYIWTLVFDDTGNLYVGTGGRGIVYQVDRTGKKNRFYDGDDNHIVALVKNPAGGLYAGTSPAGLVLEINAQGKAFALFDSSMDEIRSLTVDRFGTIVAVAASSKGLAAAKIDSGSTPNLPIVTLQALGGSADQVHETKTSVTAPGSDRDTAGSKATVYSITRDGGTEALYTSREALVYDAVVRSDGSVLAATGSKGRLISIDTAKQPGVVTDSPEEQITRLVAGGDAVYAAGSNQGRVYRLTAQPAQTGTYESRVLDAKTVATWGRVAWGTTGPATSVDISTRSGNTEKPDSTWSDWSAAYPASGQAISSPRGRYLQWRANFKRGSAAATSPDALERVQLAYIQQNLRPQVVSINVLPFGVTLQKSPPLSPGTLSLNLSTAQEAPPLNAPRERGRDRQPSSPRQLLQQGTQSFTWKATDDNDDALQFSLYLKGEGEADWKLIEKNLTDAFYTLDGSAVPDGTYTLKVVASDAPSNPAGRFLIGELVSKPFVITNATPTVEVTGNKAAGRRVDVGFRVRVGTGRVLSAEFSIDGGEWFLLFPTDGIADSAQEDYQFQTPELPPGEHVIGLRGGDANGTTGTARVVVKIQ